MNNLQAPFEPAYTHLKYKVYTSERTYLVFPPIFKGSIISKFDYSKKERSVGAVSKKRVIWSMDVDITQLYLEKSNKHIKDKNTPETGLRGCHL